LPQFTYSRQNVVALKTYKCAKAQFFKEVFVIFTEETMIF